MLYFIQAKVRIRVFGIAVPFDETITKLVEANRTKEATSKYESHVRQMFAHMNGESFEFQYLIIADTVP
jgi:hypothetical protein